MKDICPRGEPETIVLLNGHSIKTTIYDLSLHPEKNKSLILIKEASAVIVINTEIHNWPKDKE